MEHIVPATLDTTVPAAAADAAALSPLSPPRSPLPAAASASDPGSPSGGLHASYREFRLRERTREEEESRPPPPPPKDPLAPVEIIADQPGARLLEPVQPFYSSALLEPAIRSPTAASSSARKSNGANTRRSASSMQQPASASAVGSSDSFATTTPRRPLSASAKKPSASASASSTPRSASTKKDYPGVTRPTALSEARKAGVADRKESMRVLRAEQAAPDLLDMKNRPTTPTQNNASVSKAQKKFPFLQKSSGSAAGVGNGRATTPSAAAPSTNGRTTPSAANGHSSEDGPNGAVDAAASTASSSKQPASSTTASTSGTAGKRPLRTALAPSFGSSSKKPAGFDSAPSPRGTKSVAAAPSSQRTDFSALKRKGKAQAGGGFETSFEVLAAPSPKRVTIQEPAASSEENKDGGADEPDAESTALTTTTQPSKAPRDLTAEETAAMLAPRPSQVLATLDTPTPYFPAATPVRTALIPASLALENLPASSSKKVPLALAGRTGLAHECASCHELHLRVDRQNLEIHRLSEAQQKLEHVRLQADQLGRERSARNMELECLQQKLAKSEARCATLSNQLTTLRLDQEKHVKVLLVSAEEKITRASKDAAEKSTAAALAEAAAARTERDQVVLEKKGLVAKLSHISQSKRALEKSLASLEASYKTLQEHTEIVLRQKAAAEAAANNTNKIIEGQEEDAEKIARERARILAEAAQARGERDAFELEAQSLRSELDALRDSHARAESAIESQDALQHAYDSSQASLEGLSAHAADLEAQVKFERDQVRVLRADLARAQAAADAVAHRDASFSARETERSQIETSYVTELAAVRQEIAQLQREKALALEETARMRKQMESMARNQQQLAGTSSSATPGGGGYLSSPFAASSSSFAATQPLSLRQQQQHQQEHQEAPQPQSLQQRQQQKQPEHQRQLSSSSAAAQPQSLQQRQLHHQSQHSQQLPSPKSASSAHEAPSNEAQDDSEIHEEEEARRPTSAPTREQPFVRPTRASTLAAARNKSKIPRSASTSRERAPSAQAAVLETPSPRPRMASPSPSPHPKANATGAAATVVSPRKPLYSPPLAHPTAAASSSSASKPDAQPRSGSISARVVSPPPLSSVALRSKTSGSVSPAPPSATAAASARAQSVSPAPRPLPARAGGASAVPASASKLAGATRQAEAASQPLSPSGDSDTQDAGAAEGQSVPASASASVAAEDSFADQLNSYLRPVESSGSPAPAGPSYAGSSLFSPSSGSSFVAAPAHTAEDPASTAKMLASLQYLKTAYSHSHETQQALLVLEGLIQQAGILRAKMAEKQAALSKISAGGASDPATTQSADRLRAESRVLSQTLDLTKDNIRSHYAALQASLPSKDAAASPHAVNNTNISSSTPWRPSSAATASTTPASSFRPSFALTSPPATGGGVLAASSSRFGAWNATLPLTQSSPIAASGAALRGNFTSTSGLFSPTAAAPAPPARFVPASSAAASAFFQQQPPSTAGSSSFVSRSFHPSTFAPLSSSSSSAATPSAAPTASGATAPASSFMSGPFSSTFHGGSSLGVSGTVAPPPVASVAPAAGGSTFNLQVSKDAKNIYITHSTGPASAQPQSHMLQPPSAMPAFQSRPPLLTAPFNSPAPAAAGSSFAASPFASPVGTASQRPMHQHAAFHSTWSPMPASSGVGNASFLSPAGASFASRTPAAAPQAQ